MIRIETHGSWREMGRQYGEALGSLIADCMDRFAPWLREDPAHYAPAITGLGHILARHCPDLLEETAGIAEGAGIAGDAMLGYRFFPEVRFRLSEECSVVYLAASDCGPLLGRNCDLIGDFEPLVQVCQVRRPRTGPASILTTYAGLAAGAGLNAHGLAIGGASARAAGMGRPYGLPGGALCHLLLSDCHDAGEAANLLSTRRFLGKPMNLIAGDTAGASVLLECAPGRGAVVVPRAAGRTWQACTNFFLSGVLTVPTTDPGYLPNPYARYGRIAHQLGEGVLGSTTADLQRLLGDVAQPGLVCPAETTHYRTAYSQVCNLSARAMLLCPGHPATGSYTEVAL